MGGRPINHVRKGEIAESMLDGVADWRIAALYSISIDHVEKLRRRLVVDMADKGLSFLEEVERRRVARNMEMEKRLATNSTSKQCDVGWCHNPKQPGRRYCAEHLRILLLQKKAG